MTYHFNHLLVGIIYMNVIMMINFSASLYAVHNNSNYKISVT